MICRNMRFSIYLTIYCLQFSGRCQIMYLDNKLSTCTKIIGQSICQSLALGLCLVGLSAYIFSSLVQQTSFTFLMWYRWNLINLWHDEFTVMYSNIPLEEINCPGSSIGWSHNLQAGFVVSTPPWVNDFWSVYKWRFRRDLHRSAMKLL